MATVDWSKCVSQISLKILFVLILHQVMTYYIVYVFEMAGLRGNVALYSSGIEYAVFIVGTAVALLIIDRTGRRPLLIYGAICMGICMFVRSPITSSLSTQMLTEVTDRSSGASSDRMALIYRVG